MYFGPNKTLISGQIGQIKYPLAFTSVDSSVNHHNERTHDYPFSLGKSCALYAGRVLQLSDPKVSTTLGLSKNRGDHKKIPNLSFFME